MDHDYDEEAATQAAVAASLGTQDASPSKPRQRTTSLVDLTGDSDDDEILSSQRGRQSAIFDPDLQVAINQSLRRQAYDMGATVNADKPESPRTSPKPEFSAPVYGIPGIDRRKQEQERLSRLAKKRGAESLSPSSSPNRAKLPKISGRDDSTRASSGRRTESNVTSEPPIPGLEYPNGMVKKTWVFGCQRQDDIKIEEILQNSDLELAILSSFQWDMDWLFTKFDTKMSRFYLVIGAKEESKKRDLHEDFKGISQVRLCFTPMEPQVNCMHSKLMLLFHPNHLRVVIPSANLVPYDWGEQGGFMENIVFLIDLPRKSSSSAQGEEFQTSFLKELKYFMKSSGMEDNIIAKLSQFDFNNTADIAFVHTIGGSHSGDSWERTGHCGLGRAVSQLGLTTTKSVKLDSISSSLGSLNEQFMRSMYLAAQGDNGLKEFTLRTSKSLPSDRWGVTVHAYDGKEWDDNFHIYFPSLKTVKESKAGTQGAGTICFQSKWYNGNTFPNHVMKDNLSTRDGVLMHNKTLFVRPDEDIRHPRDKNLACRGWAYVGSANLSESAWGRLVLDRTTKQPKLNCRNWESGVLVPVYSSVQPQQDDVKEAKGSPHTDKKGEKAGLREVFDGHIPVPMQVPGPSYASRQTRPWYFMEDY